ncbi:hypothetical protein [Gordonia soli]|uniref:hypothetical protein n=1 Tax=Gordonia soli TaxID=320799 RepID=UPI00059081D2|nr:hypothetical protein [Gordonia soli]
MHFPYAPQSNEDDHPISTIVLTTEAVDALKLRFESWPAWDPEESGTERTGPPAYLVENNSIPGSIAVSAVEMLDNGWIRAVAHLSPDYKSRNRVDLLLPERHVIAIYSESLVHSILATHSVDGVQAAIRVRADNLRRAPRSSRADVAP